MTSADYLEQLQQDKQDLVDNLTEMGIEDLTGDETFTELVPEVLNIPSGSGDEWQRPSDWWDTETILANAEERQDDNDDTVYPAYIILIPDHVIQTQLTNSSQRGDSYLTSDGAWYGSSADINHTWDRSKDKPCSEGYKTRYVIVYTKTPNTLLDINIRTMSCLEIVLGNISCTLTCNANAQLINIVATSNTDITNIFAQYCYALKNVVLPNIIELTASAFSRCYALINIFIPNVKKLNDYVFYMCYGMSKISIPNIEYIGSDVFYQNHSFRDMSLSNKITTSPSQYIPVTTIALNLASNFISNLNISGAPSISYSSLIDIIDKLKDLTNTSENYTITLGEKNQAKLSANELQVITDKGWTLGS